MKYRDRDRDRDSFREVVVPGFTINIIIIIIIIIIIAFVQQIKMNLINLH